jgi:hypothetical protein
MGGSSQQPVTQQTQASKDPWAPAQPYLEKALTRAGSFFDDNVGYQPYTGSTQAPLDPSLLGGLTQLGNSYWEGMGGTPGVTAGRQLGTNMIQNQGLSPELKSLYEQAQGDQNPYLQSILDTNNRRIGDRVNSSVSGAGRYGSGAHTDIMTRALAESADPLLAQDYTRRQQQMQDIATGGLQRAGQWAQLMPSLDEARLAGAQGLFGIGQFMQERAQSGLNDQIKLYNAQQSYPWEQLLRMNAVAGGAGALGGTQVGSQTTPINQPSTLQKLFGGAAAGAGIGGSFGGPAGGAVGAGLGGLLGLL